MENRRFPFLDPIVEHVPVSKLRLLNRKEIRALDHPVVVHTRDKGPAAVILSYKTYMQMQKILLNGLTPLLEKAIGPDD